MRDSAPKVFVGGWLCRYPLPSMHQNSRLPGGKQAFGISHTVCTSLGTVTDQGMEGTLPKSTFPQAGQRPTLQVGFSRESSMRPAVFALFCTPVNRHFARVSFSLLHEVWDEDPALALCLPPI